MVGVFDRVFETAPVFRAEKHNTKRHLNEYTSLDFEMGYIDSFEDIMAMETGFLQYTMELLEKEYAKELRDPERHAAEGRQDSRLCVLMRRKSWYLRNTTARSAIPYDLEPEEEAPDRTVFQRRVRCGFCICNSLSVQETSVLCDGRSGRIQRYTLSFDLLYQGLEITTGGQRIHDYNMLI